MTATVQTMLLMMAVLAAVAVLARKLISRLRSCWWSPASRSALVPGLPTVELAPEVVLLVILPPLIYSAGVAMSWREFRFNLRPIALLAFGCVVFTTSRSPRRCITCSAFDGRSASCSAPSSRRPTWWRRSRSRAGSACRAGSWSCWKAKGLANDATALILYRFAVAAVATGSFSLAQAAGTFAAIVVGEIVWGIGVGWLSLRLRKWAHDPRVEITLSLMTPYLAFWVPEHLGGSGVLATVACGL